MSMISKGVFRCRILIGLLSLGALCTAGRLLAEPVLNIDASKTGEPMSVNIYSQFIEHFGRCIYGGIWAEMLEDRKFYYPITAEYKPYQRLTRSPFPIVSASPWEIVGPASSVTMVQADAFTGDQSAKITAGGGIAQHDLGVVAEKKYTGYVWLKSAGGSPTVSVQLSASGESDPVTLGSITSEYHKFPFQFTAKESTDKATLTLRVERGDVLVGAVSLMPADNIHGMRPDTLALLKKLNAPLYRWPGGNFVSGYDWRDGIGDRDRRPPRKNPAWTGVEHNDFGIDEFMVFCRELGTLPVVAVNTGFGDAYSAGQEVEYCNGPADTIGGSWRVKNGHPAPYAVKLWCVGNEMFGKWQLGFMDLRHYTLKHMDFVRSMRHVDSSIKLIGVGDLADNWSKGMLSACAAHMDFISEHFYKGHVPWRDDVEGSLNKYVGEIRDEIRARAEGHRAIQKELKLWPDKKVPIAMDEWNYVHHGSVFGEAGCRYELADALGVAIGLNEFSRQSDMIASAFYAQTVNVLGCIKTTRTDAFFESTALPLIMYREHFGSIPVKIEPRELPEGVDVAVTLTPDRKAITIALVNPRGETVSIPLRLDGMRVADMARVWRVAGNSPHLRNDENHKTALVISDDSATGREIKAPAYSASLYRYEAR